MSGWSSDEDLFGGGLSLEELAAQNADKIVQMFESADENLYADAPPPPPLPITTGPHHPNNQEERDVYQHYGFEPPPPPEPCHLEWKNFTNLRIRGVSIPLPTCRDSAAAEKVEEEIIAIHSSVNDEDLNENKNRKNEAMKQIWDKFILECKELVESENDFSQQNR
jgi:hypothetical protein